MRVRALIALQSAPILVVPIILSRPRIVTPTSNGRPGRPLACFELKLHHQTERNAFYHLSKTHARKHIFEEKIDRFRIFLPCP